LPVSFQIGARKNLGYLKHELNTQFIIFKNATVCLEMKQGTKEYRTTIRAKICKRKLSYVYLVKETLSANRKRKQLKME
jgi:hypothetical protein